MASGAHLEKVGLEFWITSGDNKYCAMEICSFLLFVNVYTTKTRRVSHLS